MVRKSKSSRSARKQFTTDSQTDTLLNKQLLSIQNSTEQNLQNKPPISSPLFIDGTTTRMASALPIWEASSILTQRKNLPWSNDPNGRLCYTRDVEDGRGAIHFWVTEDLEHESPAILAGAAALAVIDGFDIRSACLHLIYAAHAAQLEKPWEQEIVINDRQIEEYLGLKKRTDLNRQEKLALIEEIAQQAFKITTYISWPAQGKAKAFTVAEGRLWHLLETRYHFQQDLFGNKDLTGITFIIRAGLWARYFLNEEGCKDLSSYCQTGTLSKALLEDVMSVWQHREGAARLMVWLLFKTKIDKKHLMTVQTLMEIAYGTDKIQIAKQDRQLRKKLANTWDEDLLALHDKGWHIHFCPKTYPQEIQPLAFGRSNYPRPCGFFDRLLSAHTWIEPPSNLSSGAITIESSIQAETQQLIETSEDHHLLTGLEVKVRRKEKGWSQQKLSLLTGLSQGLISLIENQRQPITSENQEIIKRIFAQYP